MILIISSISSLKTPKVIPFPALATSHPLSCDIAPSTAGTGATVANGA